MYVILGANGFLGSYLLKSIIENTSDQILAVARSTEGKPASDRIRWFECDITKPEQVDALAKKIGQNEPCKFIDLAFWHNIDTVAKNPKDSWHTNITSLAYLLNKVDNLACFFFASTDCVYGEGETDYRFKESDPLNPVSLYGRHKAAAECLVHAKGYHALRLPYMFGPSLSPDRKHFYDIITADLKQDKKVDLFYDSMRSALDFESVANVFVKLAENFGRRTLPHTLNLCGDDSLSKYDLGVMLAKKLGVSTELVRATSSLNFETAPDATRALKGLMDNTLLKTLLGITELKIKV